jgi:predicted DNA-binding transcriptional regulator AlpA
MRCKTIEVVAFAAVSLLLAIINPLPFNFSLFILVALSTIISREILSRRFAKITKNSTLFDYFNTIIAANSAGFKCDIKRMVRFIDARTFRKIRMAHRAVIPATLSQVGAISLCAPLCAHRSEGRESGDDGEPPRSLNLQLYDEHAIAQCFCISKKTVQNIFSKSPHLFPPSIKIPGARGPRWTVRAVEEWINKLDREAISARAAQQTNSTPRRPGRPRIARTGGAK